MRAFRLTAPHRTEVATLREPEPGRGEVLIRVGAAGACHSDLHIIDAPAGAFPVPLTLGHENAGWIETVGLGVTGWQKGEAVAVYGTWDAGAARHVSKDARTSAMSYRPEASASVGTAAWPNTSRYQLHG
jgi:propanol-preferring alcohol dehydrogenase